MAEEIQEDQQPNQEEQQEQQTPDQVSLDSLLADKDGKEKDFPPNYPMDPNMAEGFIVSEINK